VSIDQDCFSILCTHDETTYTVVCRGEIDASATKALRDATLHALNSRLPLIVVDFRDVTFMDSTGVNALLLAHKAAQIAGVTLSLIPVPDAVMRTLVLSGADQLLEFAQH
jgi:stage II sporulation protein AA (anti-sigma F factor antagonist)